MAQFALNSYMNCDTHSIKYIGSKNKIIPSIMAQMQTLKGVKTVLDGFAGSCRVSQFFSQNNYHVTCNDIASYSFVLANCFLLGRTSHSLKEAIDHLNNLSGVEGWFTAKYGGGIDDTKKLFQQHNTKKLDAILAEMPKLNLSTLDKYSVLTSILLALDKVDSSLGHQSSYLKQWSSRSYKTMKLAMPKFYNPYNLAHTVHQKDVLAIAGDGYDLAYYDPPYGSNNDKMPASRVRYKCYYHVWESIVKNDTPITFGNNNRRLDSKDTHLPNPFEDFRKTGDNYNSDIAIQNLIDNTNSRYIMFSYNSNGRTKEDKLISIIEKHFSIINIVRIPFRKNIMAYMNTNQKWQNTLGNYEILITGQKK